MSIQLSVYSPDRKIAEGISVDSVTLTGSEGQIQVLPGHAFMVGTLETGAFEYSPTSVDGVKPENSENKAIISHGFFRVENDHVTILAGTLELASEINAERAKAAQAKAESELKRADLTEEDAEKYRRKVDRSLARQHLGSKSDH